MKVTSKGYNPDLGRQFEQESSGLVIGRGRSLPSESDKLPPAPVREDFPSTEEFEEAMGYWQSHVGRIKAMAARAQPSKDSPEPSK